VVQRSLPVLGLLVCSASPLVHAQPVLHEFVPEVADEEGELIVGDGRGGEPAALVYDGEVIPAPTGGAQRVDERPLKAEPSGGSGPAFRPDRLTELEEVLGYYAVFTPSVTPFKRVTALDSVRLDQDGRTPVLAPHGTRVRALRVEGAEVPPPDARPRDRFWGDVLLDFRDGRRVPLPSVSPESRILTVRTEPAVALRFEKDGADAYFAVAVGAVPQQQVRLVFLTDAPRSYFNAPLPPVAADTLAHEVPPMPSSVRSRARAFAGELGLAPSDALPDVLSTLVGHFRSFEESAAPPEDRGDIYMDLARSKKGVCRHRTYAFVITAQGLGIPARFVYNEAHSWAEVKLPAVGWMRVDLGGAARGLQAHGAEDRPQYHPRHPDPLPRPEAYEGGYSQLGGDVAGLRQDARGGRGQGAGEGPRATSAPGASFGEGPSPSANTAPAPESPSSRAEAPRERSRIPVRLALDQSRQEAYRGRGMEVRGRVTDDRGRGVAGLRIEVLLRRRDEHPVGVTVTGDDGRFQGTFGVAPDLPVGDYELVVRTPGDDVHAAGVAY
jgi:transglutaminase-like putative cysteine protease